MVFTTRPDGVSRYAEEIDTSGNGIFALVVRISVYLSGQCLLVCFVRGVVNSGFENVYAQGESFRLCGYTSYMHNASGCNVKSIYHYKHHVKKKNPELMNNIIFINIALK